MEVGILGELEVLFHGLATNLWTPDRVSTLPSRPPDIRLDAMTCLIFSLMLFMLNWGVRLLLVVPAIKLFTRVKPHQVQKLAQSVMEALFYGGFALIGLRVVPTMSWAWPSKQWWIGFMDGGHEVMRSDLRCYYSLYAGRYLQMSASLSLEPKRADLGMMIVHHVVTLLLICISYTCGWNRVGSVIMVVMDPGDVPLHIAKACKYMAESQSRRTWWHFFTSRMFETFAATFFFTRILLFGYITWSMTFEGSQHIPNFGGRAGFAAMVLVDVLLLLQILWFRLIVKVVFKMLRGEDPDDVRSDDEGATEKDASCNGKARRKKKQPDWVSYLALATVIALSANEAWGIAGRWETAWTDVRAYLGSLSVVWQGSTALAALPKGPPDIPRDRCVFSIFSAVILLCNWGMRLALVEPFARYFVRLKGAQVAKFAQSVMEVVVYGGFTVLGLLVLPQQEFVWPSYKWWKGFADGGHEIMRLDLRCYYILYVARYFQALVSLLFEAKRKDFFQMLIHHLATIMVIYVSYVYGWNRVGVVVMGLLDPADVPLHLAKLCKYTAESTHLHVWQFLADRLFEFFGVTFFVTRIVLYGYVCWSAHIEATRYFPKGVPEWTCVVLLYTLLILQCYWFSLIVKVALKLISGKSVEDIRSDDEDEDTGSKKNGKKNQ